MNAIEPALIDGWQPAVNAAVKALALFLTVALAFRFTQRRTLAEFTPFDWVTAVAVGAIVGRTATAADTSWLVGAAALLTLIAAHAVVNKLRFVPWLRRFIDPPLRVLIRDGHVNHRDLRRSGLTEDDLLAALRQQGHMSTAEVKLALFERKGSVSVIAQPDSTSSHRAPTAEHRGTDHGS